MTEKQEQTELKPRPDPTAQTDAAIARLHELIKVHLDSIKVMTDLKFVHAKEMLDERIRSIQLQFQERDMRARVQEEKQDGFATRLTRSEGHNSGVAISWAVVVAAIGILMGFGGLFVALMRKG